MNWDQERKAFWKRQRALEICIFALGLTTGLTLGIVGTLIFTSH